MSTQIETLYGPVSSDIIAIAKQIKLLICDVDGVFSDGLVYMGNDGEELKTFHTRDGYGVKSLMSAGVEIAIITGRQSKIVENRMSALASSLSIKAKMTKSKPIKIFAVSWTLPQNILATLVMTSLTGP